MSNQDTHELSRRCASSSSLPPLAGSSRAQAEREVAQALATFQHALERLRHAGAELERFRVQLRQLLLAAALLGDELKYRPLAGASPPDASCPTRPRSASHQDRLRQALEEIESSTVWTPEFGRETVDDVLRRRATGVRTRIAELEAVAQPCIDARAQLKAECDQLSLRQQRRRRVSILPPGALACKSKSVQGPQATDKLAAGGSQALADKLALATRTLVEALRSLDEAERQRADDDAELVRLTLAHFFLAGSRALQAPRRASVSAYCAEATRGDNSAARVPGDERGPRDNTCGGDGALEGDGHAAELAPPPPAPPRSLSDFRPTRKQVRYQHASGADAGHASWPPTARKLKLPTVDELVALTARHLPWTRRRSSDPQA